MTENISSTWTTRVVVGVFLMILSLFAVQYVYVQQTVTDIATRVAVIEGNRFTSKDAEKRFGEMQAQFISSLGKIQESLVQIRADLPKEIPPSWFRIQVESLEGDVSDLTAQLISIDNRLRELESFIKTIR